MSDQIKPLESVRAAHEEEYYLRQNQALIAKMRDRLAKEAAALALEERSGVHDPQLLSWLAELGVTADHVPILHLVPLIQVAWADGTLQDEERVMLEKAAAEAGVTPDSPAHAVLAALLNERPKVEFYDAALMYVRTLVAAMSDADAHNARENLLSLARQVAKASGGLFGLFPSVGDAERSALQKIAAQLEARPAASGLAQNI